MQAGISTATLFLRQNNEDAVSLFSEWGVRTAEVFLTSFCEYNEEFARLVAKNKGEVNVHSVHVLNTQVEPQLYSEHPRVRQDAYDCLKNVMLSANVLGAKYYTFHGIARIKRTFQENWKRFGEHTQKIEEFCNSFGVTLCYENVEWALYNRPGIFAKLKEYCPSLKGVLDLKQARITGYDWREYFNEMGQDITHVHASDVTADGKMCLPGQGIFPFDELFSRLKDVGFHGAVLVENYGKDYSEEAEILRSYEFLKELAEKYS